MSEWGIYGESVGYGVAIGWDSDEGLTISGFKGIAKLVNSVCDCC